MYTDEVTVPGGSSFEVIAHESPGSDAIIINYPGRGGDINGFNNKYRQLGSILAQFGLGACIQMPNIEWEGRDYQRSLVEDLLAVCTYAEEHSERLIENTHHKLYLMGFSAGGGAVACAAYSSHASKILLVAPSFNVGKDQVETFFLPYDGETYIAIGEEDDVVGVDCGRQFFELAKCSPKKKLVTIPDCDHQFRGTRNGMIMSKAPFWAFAGDDTFPDPEGGIELY